MRRSAIIASLALLAFPAAAVDRGQFETVDPAVRAWFKSVKSPNGVPCCDRADGHRTTWRATAAGTYEVPIDGAWIPVPPEAVILGAHNPTGESVVWYTKFPGSLTGPFIRCFVPADGA